MAPPGEGGEQDVGYLRFGRCCWNDPSCGGERPGWVKAAACKQNKELLNFDPHTFKLSASPNEPPT